MITHSISSLTSATGLTSQPLSAAMPFKVPVTITDEQSSPLPGTCRANWHAFYAKRAGESDMKCFESGGHTARFVVPWHLKATNERSFWNAQYLLTTHAYGGPEETDISAFVPSKNPGALTRTALGITHTARLQLQLLCRGRLAWLTRRFRLPDEICNSISN